MLNRIFQAHCRDAGSRTALVFGSHRYTYAQLEEHVARCAAGLKRLGAVSENGVALVLKNSPEFIFSYLAALRLGIPAFLLDPGSKPSELRRVFADHPVGVAVCEPEQVLPLKQASELTGQGVSVCPRGEDFERTMGQTTEPFPSRVYDAEIAVVQYTSGSTGVPKCIARSHRNLFCEAEDFNQTARISPDDRILCTIPLFHAHAFVNAFLAALYAGATLVLLEEFNRSAVVDLFAREHITVFPAVPIMFDLLSRAAISHSRPGNSLRLVFSSGAPLPGAVAREFGQRFGVYVRQLYGTTEVGAAAINLDPDPLSSLDSVGSAIKNVGIEILDEDGSAVPAGELGEVAIHSPAMADGYWGQPELTRQRFRNGYFWPGDRGRKDTRGYLHIEGRADWLVLRTGRKIDPHEIEAVITTLPKVQEAVVVGVPGYLGELVVKAVVVCREACQEAEIVEYCRQRLADFKIPRLVQFVDVIPRNAAGKILRKELVA
jgi:long-chain acyl-CoA synthetase